MKKLLIISLLIAQVLQLSAGIRQRDFVPVADSSYTIYKFDIKEMIAPAIWRKVDMSVDEAHTLGADLILIDMNTYGGMVDAADSIRTKLLNSKIPVYVYINKNAASAGALISIACDRIYMSPGSSIGAATVVNQTGEVAPDKFQSYMRSTMRSTAEAHGKDTIISGNDTIYKWRRDPLIAEAMVDPNTYVEGVSDTGEVLTFTVSEAIKHGYCEGEAESIPQLLDEIGFEQYELKQYNPTGLDKIISLFLNPVLQGILIMVIIGGIYFELQTPGIGFPIGAAALAAVLYFSPLYLEGLAENWELALFFLGIVLLAVEIFVIPGFGVAGVLGIGFMVTGLTLSMVDNIVFEMDSELAFDAILKSFLLVTVSTFLSLFGSVYLSKRLMLAPRLSKLFVLDKTQDSNEGYSSYDKSYTSLVGKSGVSKTVLRPSGRIEVDGELYDARSEYGYIEKDSPVKVIRFEAGQAYVIPVKSENNELS